MGLDCTWLLTLLAMVVSEHLVRQSLREATDYQPTLLAPATLLPPKSSSGYQMSSDTNLNPLDPNFPEIMGAWWGWTPGS